MQGWECVLQKSVEAAIPPDNQSTSFNTFRIFDDIRAQPVVLALDNINYSGDVFDCCLRLLECHLDVTHPSVDFKKLYGFRVADGISFATYFGEYVLLVPSVTGPGRRKGLMIVEYVQLGASNRFQGLALFLCPGGSADSKISYSTVEDMWKTFRAYQ